MKKILIASAVAALFAVPALAGDLSVKGNARVGAGVGVGASGVGASVNAGANAGANAGSRGPSVNATENSNGSFAADREFGRARAEERMSAEGQAHERASSAPRKRLHKPELPQAGADAAAAARGSGSADARTR